MRLTDQQWMADECPGCDGNLYDEPRARCDTPRFRLLHWLCYLSEDRICAAWQHDNQATVLSWCESNRIPDGQIPCHMEVTESEASEVLALVEEPGGEWLWDDARHIPRWHQG